MKNTNEMALPEVHAALIKATDLCAAIQAESRELPLSADRTALNEAFFKALGEKCRLQVLRIEMLNALEKMEKASK